MSYNECYNVCSENATIYCAPQGGRCICFDTYVRSSVDQRECGTVCPGNCSQSCGGENLYSFHLNFLWLTPVEAASTRTPMRQSVITGPFQATQRCRMKFIIVVQSLAASMRFLCLIGNRELFPPLEVALPMSSRSLVHGLPGRREIHWLRALSLGWRQMI